MTPQSSPFIQRPDESMQSDGTTPLSMAMLSQQLPPLPKFAGDSQIGAEEERFDEWLERLEMVAGVCGWNEQAKLVNLVTRLRGPAYSFYRSCAPQQRSSFQVLRAALAKRFTPVYLKSVQSSRFHERKQQESETVDNYAQELKKLFYRAYPSAQQGTTEAEAMGRSVLTCQFVAGLKKEIKAKVAGAEGEFEQLVVKARFEEAKLHDLVEQPHKAAPRKPFSATPTLSPPRGMGLRQQVGDRDPSSIRHQAKQGTITTGRCFNCGGLGHLARNCCQRGRGGPREAQGRYQGQGNEQVAKIDAAGEIEKPPSVPRDRVEELRRQLKEAEVEEALNMITATMKGITLPGDQENPLLGPTVTTEVIFEGMPVVALLDTESPVTIVSLEFALRALAARRPEGQHPEEWKQGVKDRLETPTIKLRNYGGGELDIVSQMKAQISKGGNSLIGTVQVQKGAPVELLMGTDLQPQLEFLYFEPRQENIATDLFSSKLWNISEAHSLPGPHQPQETTRPPAEPPMVRLINATRLPARHVKLVRARIDCPWEKSFSLFESAKESLEQEGLQMEDGVAEPDERGVVTLTVQNHSPEPVCLKKGQVLGKLQQAVLLSAPTPTEEAIGSEVKMVHTQTSRQLPSSVQEGGIAVSIPEVVAQSLEDLPTTESDQLRTILTEYADTFTQSDADLGSTNVVSHSINTGDHSPIQQPPRRIHLPCIGKWRKWWITC